MHDLLRVYTIFPGLQAALHDFYDVSCILHVLEKVVEDWQLSNYDDSTCLALLGVVTEHFEIEIDALLSMSTPLAQSVMRNSPENMKSRPFIRWMLLKAMSSDEDTSNDFGLVLENLYFSRGLYCPVSWEELPLYIPVSVEKPGWRLKDAPAQFRDPVKLAMNTSEELGDYKSQALCLKQLIRMTSKPEKALGKLCHLLKMLQGDLEDYHRALIFGYLIYSSDVMTGQYKAEVESQVTTYGWRRPDTRFLLCVLLYTIEGNQGGAEKAIRLANEEYDFITEFLQELIDEKMPYFVKQMKGEKAQATRAQSDAPYTDQTPQKAGKHGVATPIQGPGRFQAPLGIQKGPPIRFREPARHDDKNESPRGADRAGAMGYEMKSVSADEVFTKKVDHGKETRNIPRVSTKSGKNEEGSWRQENTRDSPHEGTDGVRYRGNPQSNLGSATRDPNQHPDFARSVGSPPATRGSQATFADLPQLSTDESSWDTSGNENSYSGDESSWGIGSKLDQQNNEASSTTPERMSKNRKTGQRNSEQISWNRLQRRPLPRSRQHSASSNGPFNRMNGTVPKQEAGWPNEKLVDRTKDWVSKRSEAGLPGDGSVDRTEKGTQKRVHRIKRRRGNAELPKRKIERALNLDVPEPSARSRQSRSPATDAEQRAKGNSSSSMRDGGHPHGFPHDVKPSPTQIGSEKHRLVRSKYNTNHTWK